MAVARFMRKADWECMDDALHAIARTVGTVELPPERRLEEIAALLRTLGYLLTAPPRPEAPTS